MTHQGGLPGWTMLAPVAGWGVLGAALALGAYGGGPGVAQAVALAVALVACVLAAVHHAEVVALRVGEPFGTLVLALAVTVIEVALIVSLTLAGGPAASALARDTVFAAVMIILTGIVGVCMMVGGTRHGEQSFRLDGVSASLLTLAAISVLTMVLPNYTVTVPGPYYSPSQLAFVAVICVVLYGAFVLVQTVRHRGYFLAQDPAADDEPAVRPTPRVAGAALALLFACLGAVVLLAKSLAPAIESAVAAAGAPNTLVGVIVAAVVLLPEGLAAVSAARANRLQTSLNLALGSALASIGLTIPAVAIVSLASGWTLTLGIDGKSTVLLLLALFASSLSLGVGRTTILQGAVHLVIFAVYLFTTVVP